MTKNEKYSKKDKIVKKINQILNTIDSVNIIGSISTRKTLSIKALAKIVVPITAGVGCGVAFTTNLAMEHLEKK